MSLSDKEIIDACLVISEQEKLKYTFGQIAKGVGIVATSTALFGLLGPFGLFFGAAAGGVGSALCLKYESLPKIYARMTSDEKQKFVNYMRAIFDDVCIVAAAGLLPWVKSKGDGYDEIAEVLKSFTMEQIQDA